MIKYAKWKTSRTFADRPRKTSHHRVPLRSSTQWLSATDVHGDGCEHRRLHSNIGYITPSDMLAGIQKEIHEARDRKLEEAREARSEIRVPQAEARYAKRTRPENRAMLGSPPPAES